MSNFIPVAITCSDEYSHRITDVVILLVLSLNNFTEAAASVASMVAKPLLQATWDFSISHWTTIIPSTILQTFLDIVSAVSQVWNSQNNSCIFWLLVYHIMTLQYNFMTCCSTDTNPGILNMLHNILYLY